jgi:hypothetical protein
MNSACKNARAVAQIPSRTVNPSEPLILVYIKNTAIAIPRIHSMLLTVPQKSCMANSKNKEISNRITASFRFANFQNKIT